MTRPLFCFDADAAVWFVVALLVSAFATIPLLSVGLALTGGPLDGATYIAATGGLSVLVFAVATGLLVRARPWRTYRDILLTLYVLQLGAAVLQAAGQFVRAPLAGGLVMSQLISPLTFGIVQIESLDPLRFAFPDAWPLVGAVLGMAVARWAITTMGRPVGEPARPVVVPMRLPRP